MLSGWGDKNQGCQREVAKKKGGKGMICATFTSMASGTSEVSFTKHLLVIESKEGDSEVQMFFNLDLQKGFKDHKDTKHENYRWL